MCSQQIMRNFTTIIMYQLLLILYLKSSKTTPSVMPYDQYLVMLGSKGTIPILFENE